MSFTYNPAKQAFGSGALDLQTADLRVRLVMTDTTADTDSNAATLSAITTLDTMDGANYADQGLVGVAFTPDPANNRSELDADDIVFTNLGPGTRQVAGWILYAFGTNDADSQPIAFYDGGGFPFAATGSDVTLQFDPQGLLQIL